jgi:hypothetical protein
LAIGEIATRDYLRGELDRLRHELVDEVKPRKRKGSKPDAETLRDSPAWDDEPEHLPS